MSSSLFLILLVGGRLAQVKVITVEPRYDKVIMNSRQVRCVGNFAISGRVETYGVCTRNFKLVCDIGKAVISKL